MPFFSKLLNVLLGPGAIKERKKEMEIERKEVNLNRIKDRKMEEREIEEILNFFERKPLEG